MNEHSSCRKRHRIDFLMHVLSRFTLSKIPPLTSGQFGETYRQFLQHRNDGVVRLAWNAWNLPSREGTKKKQNKNEEKERNRRRKQLSWRTNSFTVLPRISLPLPQTLSIRLLHASPIPFSCSQRRHFLFLFTRLGCPIPPNGRWERVYSYATKNVSVRGTYRQIHL